MLLAYVWMLLVVYSVKMVNIRMDIAESIRRPDKPPPTLPQL